MTLGADGGLGGGGGDGGRVGGGGGADDPRHLQRLLPWEGCAYRTPSLYEMGFCACEPPYLVPRN